MAVGLGKFFGKTQKNVKSMAKENLRKLIKLQFEHLNSLKDQNKSSPIFL